MDKNNLRCAFLLSLMVSVITLTILIITSSTFICMPQSLYEWLQNYLGVWNVNSFIVLLRVKLLRPFMFFSGSGSNIVNVVTRFWVGWSVPQIRAGARDFSLLQNVQTGCGAHPASYSMGMEGSFLRSEAGGTWGWPLTSVSCQG